MLVDFNYCLDEAFEKLGIVGRIEAAKEDVLAVLSHFLFLWRSFASLKEWMQMLVLYPILLRLFAPPKRVDVGGFGPWVCFGLKYVLFFCPCMMACNGADLSLLCGLELCGLCFMCSLL